VHMAWGTVNEWTTQTGYARLAAHAKHPVLGELLRRIMKQEGRHIDFYAMQAKARLGESAAAQRLTRFALRRYWEPVGSGVMPAREVRFSPPTSSATTRAWPPPAGSTARSTASPGSRASTSSRRALGALAAA
jgi:hypothetical protein